MGSIGPPEPEMVPQPPPPPELPLSACCVGSAPVTAKLDALGAEPMLNSLMMAPVFRFTEVAKPVSCPKSMATCWAESTTTLEGAF